MLVSRLIRFLEAHSTTANITAFRVARAIEHIFDIYRGICCFGASVIKADCFSCFIAASDAASPARQRPVTAYISRVGRRLHGLALPGRA